MYIPVYIHIYIYTPTVHMHGSLHVMIFGPFRFGTVNSPPGFSEVKRLGKLFDEWIEMTQEDVDEVCEPCEKPRKTMGKCW